MSVIVLRGDARSLPLPDASVDLIVTSPPYFGLRSYTDAGEVYEGQIGSEYTPNRYLETLLECTAEWVRVLKPSGSIFVNLGDKYSTYTGANWGNGRSLDGHRGQRKVPDGGPVNAPDVYGVPYKSLMGLPWRYVLGCIGTGSALDSTETVKLLLRDIALGVITLDMAEQIVDELAAVPAPGLGLALRAEIIWDKPNGMPESATDRVRRSHEQVFHFTKQPRYYSAVDEIRKPASAYSRPGSCARPTPNGQRSRAMADTVNPLGRLPGSVWEIPSQPLAVPSNLGVDHFAVFPMELPRRIILGWSPPGICMACGEGRRAVTDVATIEDRKGRKQRIVDYSLDAAHGPDGRGGERWKQTVRIIGNACACTPYTDHPERRGKDFHAAGDRAINGRNDGNGGARARRYQEELANPRGPVREYHFDGWIPPPARPAVVLDPFGGTGTTALVAGMLGRVGVSVDRSADYCRLARWRTTDPAERAKALGVPKPPTVPDGQTSLFDGSAA